MSKTERDEEAGAWTRHAGMTNESSSAVEGRKDACDSRSAHMAALVTLTKCICSRDEQAECCPQHGRFATLQEAWDAGREHERVMSAADGVGRRDERGTSSPETATHDVVPQEVHDRGWQWRPVGEDGAFAPPFGTIRACDQCGCLVAGGPTRCTRCVDAVQYYATSNRERAPRDRKRTCRHCSAYIERSDQRCSNDSYCTPIDFGGLGADNAGSAPKEGP